MEKTIAAISTAPAPGGIGMVRISGKGAFAVADRVFRGVSGRAVSQMKGYTAQLGGAFTPAGERLDDVVALVYRSPKSYTGEDVVELSCHGGLYVTKRLLQLVLDAGASPAGPGEFTRRAFLNGKVDLAQAEAVMGVIGASGEQALKAAQAGSSGVLSKRIQAIKAQLLVQASHLAAWADFPEEDVPTVEEQGLLSAIREGEESLARLLAGFERGRMYREGLSTVIAGRPNAGKSTLMNLLSGCERSIVTQYAGTTRDVVEETVLLAGVPLRLADTAGIRDTDDPVESIGVQAAKRRLKSAQLVLAVFDSSQSLEKEDWELMDTLQGVPAVAIVNKTDLPTQMDVGGDSAPVRKDRVSLRCHRGRAGGAGTSTVRNFGHKRVSPRGGGAVHPAAAGGRPKGVGQPPGGGAGHGFGHDVGRGDRLRGGRLKRPVRPDWGAGQRGDRGPGV